MVFPLRPLAFEVVIPAKGMVSFSIEYAPLGQRIPATARQTEHDRAEQIEHGQFDGPAAGHRVDGENLSEVRHEDGNDHVAGKHHGGRTCPQTDDYHEGSDQLGRQRAIGDEGGQSHLREHAADEADTGRQFMDSVKQHEAADGESQYKQSSVIAAQEIFC